MVSKNHISVERRKGVEAAIINKINALKYWVENAIPWKAQTDGTPVRNLDGELEPIDLPTDLTAFAEWTATVSLNINGELRAIELAAVGRTTLYQTTYKTIAREARTWMKLAKEKANQQIEQTNKVSIIASLNKELIFERKVNEQQELDVIRLRREADAAKIAFSNEHALRLRNENELQGRIATLEAKVANLTESLSKIVPLQKNRR